MIRRFRPIAFVLGLIAIPALAAAQSQPASADTGWRTVIYPIRVWLPVFGADVRLPEVPGSGEDGDDDGATIPAAHVSSNFNGAAAAGLRIERGRLSIDGSFLWAGMSGEVGTPFARVEIDTISGRLFGGVRVLPSLYIDGGVRRLALKLTATIREFPTETWKPGIWEPAIGLTYRPEFGRTLRLFAQGNVGGIGQDDHRTAEAAVTLEWKPIAHFAVGAGYGVLYVRADGTLRSKPVYLKQTLHGPTFTIGIPF